MALVGSYASGINLWNLFAGYTQYYMQLPNGQTFTPITPQKVLKVFTTYTLSGGLKDLTIGGGVNWQGKTYSDVTSPSGGQRVGQDSFAIYSLMSRYQFTPLHSCRLR